MTIKISPQLEAFIQKDHDRLAAFATSQAKEADRLRRTSMHAAHHGGRLSTFPNEAASVPPLETGAGPSSDLPGTEQRQGFSEDQGESP